MYGLEDSSTLEYWSVIDRSGNEVNLQTYAFNIETWGGERQAPPVFRGGNLLIPGKPGETFLPKLPASNSLTLAMWVIGADETGNIPSSGDVRAKYEQNWEMLKSIFWNRGQQFTLVKRFRRFGNPNIIEAKALAEFAGGLQPSMDGTQRARFSVQLRLADPFFYGAEESFELTPTIGTYAEVGRNGVKTPKPIGAQAANRYLPSSAAVAGVVVPNAGVSGTTPAYKVTFTGNPTNQDGPVYGRSTDTDVEITGGTQTSLSAWVKVERPLTLALWVEFFTNSGALVGAKQFGIATKMTANKWSELPGVFSPGATATRARIGVMLVNSGDSWRVPTDTPGDAVYFDQVQSTSYQYSKYYDGATSDFGRYKTSWVGTAYDSVTKLEKASQGPATRITVDGDYPTTEIEIEFKGSLTSPELENLTNQIMVSYDRTLDSSTTAYMDIPAFQVVEAGITRNGYVEHSGHKFWFALDPGENDITLTSTGSGKATVKYKPRFY